MWLPGPENVELVSGALPGGPAPDASAIHGDAAGHGRRRDLGIEVLQGTVIHQQGHQFGLM
jgi:hypothetical protein